MPLAVRPAIGDNDYIDQGGTVMDRRKFVTIAFLLLTPALVEGQNPGEGRSLDDILNGVKKRAEDAKRDDQRRALQMLDRAAHGHKHGRLEEALDLARKAQQLFPESPDLRKAVAGFQADAKAARARSANLEEARTALTEAVEYAQQLIKEDRLAEARELLEAVQHLLDRFPGGIDLTTASDSTHKLLAELRVRSADSLVELIPVPPRVVVDNLSPSEMRLLLARRVTIDWHGEPLSKAFTLIHAETGLTIKVDPYLERLGVLERTRTDLRISNAPVERLLRMVTDLAGVAYVLRDSEVYVTTKANALALAMGQPAPRSEASATRRPPPTAAPLLPTPPPAKSAGYLISGQALREHVEELLRLGEPRKQDVDEPRPPS
jgi:hypothetical protein